MHLLIKTLAAVTTAILLAPYPAGAGTEARQPQPEWRILGNGSDQQYCSPSAQIDQSNVSQLGLAWYADMDTQDGLVGNPPIADGAVYQSGPPGKIYANDLKSGKSLWVFTPDIEYAEGTS